jgi:hypothetical protein
MSSKAIGQLLGCAKRVKESPEEKSKGHWIVSGPFLQGIGKPLGNVPIIMIPAEKMFLIAGRDEKS